MQWIEPAGRFLWFGSRRGAGSATDRQSVEKSLVYHHEKMFILRLLPRLKLGAERQGTGIAPRGERRSDYGRQAPVGTDAVNRDVIAESVCYADEPSEEVHCQGTGIAPCGERRSDYGRQGTAFSDAEGRDVVAAGVCHIDEPAHRHRNGAAPRGKRRPGDRCWAPFSAMRKAQTLPIPFVA